VAGGVATGWTTDGICTSRYAVDDVGDFVIVQVGTNTIISGYDVGGGTIRLSGNDDGDIDDGDFIFV
jgi:hypothetical protein